MPRTQIATPDLTALFSGGVAPPAFELRENRCETTDMADDRAPYVQSSGLGGGQGPSPIIGRSAIETAEGDKQLPDLLERACAPVGSSRLEKQPRVVVYACAISDSIAGRASIIRWNTAPPGLTASPARSR